MMAEVCMGTLICSSSTIATTTPMRMTAQITILRGSFVSSSSLANASLSTSLRGQRRRPIVSM